MTAQLNLSQSKFGMAGMLCGCAALIVVVLHFWAGPLAPQKTLERSLAETAVNFAKEVVRVAKDEPAEVRRRGWDADDTVRVAGAALATLAILLAVFGFVRKENYRPGVAASVLGASAIAFQFFTWFALALLGCLLIFAVLSMFGDFFSA